MEMNKFTGAAVLAVATCFGVGATEAQAADGGICYTPETATTYPNTYSTITYPLLLNDTKFYCLGTTTAYTIRQLAQGGWRFAGPPVPVMTSSTTTSSSTTHKQRWQLTIQR